MDMVISDVSTVENEEEDEPLYEISKVETVFREKKTTTFTKEVRPTKYNKTCYVPSCPSSSKSTPEKMFITVPVNPARRKLWLDVVGKNTVGRNPKSPMFCCQDHFNLKQDMKNYEEHLKRGRVQMLLHPTVVPHIFICNEYGHLKRNERIAVLRRLHRGESNFQEIEEDFEQKIAETTIRKMTPRQNGTVKKSGKVTPNKTVFIAMPAFEYEDQPEYIEIKEDGVETIVIDDDSD